MRSQGKWWSWGGNAVKDDANNEPLLQDEEHPLSAALQDSGSDIPQLETAQQLSHWEDPDSMRFLYMGGWVACCTANFVLGRLLALDPIPYDALYPLDKFALYDTVTRMMLYSLVLGWFVRIGQREKFVWLFNWRRWYFFVLFFGVNPLYSAISDIKSLHYSLKDVSEWSTSMKAVAFTGLALMLVVIIWHIVLAFRRKKLLGAVLYFLARMAVIGYYWACSSLLSTSRHNDIHLHHYFTAWCFAIFAEFNHPVSGAFLAVMSAIFIQGISAYTFAPLFNDPSCFDTIPVTQATCVFKSDGNFTLNICPGPFGTVPESKCYRKIPKFASDSGKNGGMLDFDFDTMEPLELFMHNG